MYFDDVVVKLTVATSAGTVKVSDIVSNLKLNIAGTEYSASPTSFAACTTAVALTTSCDVIFYDVNYQKVSKDATVPMTVTADIKNINATVFDEGDTVKAEITSTQYNATRIEDMNRDSLPTAKRTGSSIGEVMTLQSKGISLSFVSAPTPVIVSNTGANDDTATFSMKFRVTANGGDMYLAKNPNTNTSLSYKIDRSGALTAGTTGILTDDTDATIGTMLSSVMYKIANGSSEDFTVTFSANNGGLASNLNRLLVDGIKWYFADATTVPVLVPGTNGGEFTSSTFNFNDFKTSSVAYN